MLENFAHTLKLAIKNTAHIHARVGYQQGPQVPDPRLPQWNYALNAFTSWWDEIVLSKRRTDQRSLTITTEFGPAPYMVHHPKTGKPIADQFKLNF